MTDLMPHQSGPLIGMAWNVFGQVYTPEEVSAERFTWHAVFPEETFVPPHIHTDQDEWLTILDGEIEYLLDGRPGRVAAGETVTLPMGVPHGLFNNSGEVVTCRFSVTPTGRLFDLFTRLHNVANTRKAVEISAAHNVDFLPPVQAGDLLRG